MGLPTNWKIGFAEVLGFVSLGGSILVAGYVVGVALSGVESDVGKLGIKVEKNTESIIRVEAQAKEDQNKVLDEMRDVKRSMETIRVEAKDDRQRILDQLIRLNGTRQDQ